MKTMKTFVLKPLGYLLPVAIVSIWILGLVHGKKRHEVDPLEFDGFYMCFYYGVEKFWHPIDYKALNDNVTIGASLLLYKIESKSPKEELEFVEAKEDYKKRLKKLSEKELLYVKEGVRTYLEFYASSQDDVFEALHEFKTTKNFVLSVSANTSKLAEKCKTYGLERATTMREEKAKAISDYMEEKLNGSSSDLTDDFELIIKDKVNQIKRSYTELFPRTLGNHTN
jgi:hypothetical protein